MQGYQKRLGKFGTEGIVGDGVLASEPNFQLQ
jgi:hypothetical protein